MACSLAAWFPHIRVKIPFKYLILCFLSEILSDLVSYFHAEEARYEDAHNLENTNEEESVHCGTVFAGIFLQKDKGRSHERQFFMKAPEA